MARKGTITKTIRLPDGSRKWLYAKSEEEMRRKLLDCQVQVSMGIELTNHDTFGEYAQMWYKTYKEPKVRSKTKESILNVLNNHLLPYLSGYRMRDIAPMHIQCVFNHLLDKSESLNVKAKCVLKAIFEAAQGDGVILRSPMTKTLNIGGVKAEEKEALTQEEADTLLDALAQNEASGAKNCRLFCFLGLKTGLRRGELCGLMWNDIDLDAAELTVRHNCIWPKNTGLEISDNLKTPAARRSVPLSPSVVSALRRERKVSNSLYVFHRKDGQPLSQSAFRKMWEHTKKAGLAVTLTPHILRHTYCTRLFELGFDIKEIQYLMGHSKSDMTLRIYTHYSKKSRYADTADRIRAAL